MTMICTTEYLDRAAKENPDMTFLEYIAMLQVRRITGEQEEMTLEDAKEFAQIERDRIDLEYDMTHQ
ncbi:MAG: hypothetical protein ACLSAJ_12370 [Intestinibacter bartlettii]|jgi:hypothetical protein|uniref:hypothetical protein n=1 Tax=Intestinibacter bartlettii TaxID=261299 RepID=UPI0020558C16|nr:MAG TPA: hypothetical protein [Caudoviricetes sp.]